MMMRLVLVLCLMAGGASSDVTQRVEEAFRGWTDDTGVSRGTLTLWRGADKVSDLGIGAQPDASMPLASVGKAITASCAATLIETSDWTLETTSAQVLGYGAPGITVAQLMTHTSGLFPDGTQGLGLLGLFKAPGADMILSRRALERSAQDSVPGQYQYNNENFAILGAMIAAQTGRSYVDYCTAAVLTPAGVQAARAHPPMAALTSFGGWEMPVQDYARFMHWAYGPDGIIGGDLARWPVADVGGGAFYGVGMLQRAHRGSHSFWHFGLLCFPNRVNAGSYAVSYRQDWRIVAAFEGCVTFDQLFALDAALSGAVFP